MNYKLGFIGAGNMGSAIIAGAAGFGADNIYVYDAVDSTNTQCKRLAMDGAADGTVVLAEEQTAGRGRKGRSFQSPRGLGLYLSVLWRPSCEPAKLLPLTALAAVAVSRAVERVTGEQAAIKWPNDLLLRDRKIAGILTEMALEGESGQIDYVVLGIGVNVHHTPADFTEEVASMASSLDAVLGTFVSRPRLAAAVFSDRAQLARLNEIVNPRIWAASQAAFEALEQDGKTRILYDAPTLFQAGFDRNCDAVIGVVAPRAVRMARIMARDGLSEGAAAARIDAQPDEAFYRERCRYILENGGDLAALEAQINALCRVLDADETT